MITSRSIADLCPTVSALAQKHIDLCKAAGVDLLIYCTFRDSEAQNLLFKKGRTEPGPVVTNAKGGDSLHQYHVAYDCVPLRHGKPLWNVFTASHILEPEWSIVVAKAKSLGLEWAGDWKTFHEFAHFQFTGGLTLADFKLGKHVD